MTSDFPDNFPCYGFSISKPYLFFVNFSATFRVQGERCYISEASVGWNKENALIMLTLLTNFNISVGGFLA
jgi:hypothetical protein